MPKKNPSNKNKNTLMKEKKQNISEKKLKN